MQEIVISKELKLRCPNLRLGCINAEVSVTESPEALLAAMDTKIQQLGETLTIESISKIPTITASRKGYKVCGKDPARYRLSAEALLRRVVSGKGLYQINNVVDQLNLVSITSGFSIGGYDASQIKGNVSFGIGNEGEPYSGIGRGELNIECLPVFRDERGAFGTPTSDSSRTEVTAQTRNFLMVIIDFDFDCSAALPEAMQLAEKYLIEYCSAKTILQQIIE